MFVLRVLSLLLLAPASPALAAAPCDTAGYCWQGGDGRSLALDANLRLRSMQYDPTRFGIGAGGSDGYLLLRSLFSADYRQGHWGGHAQLGAHAERGKAGGPGPTDQGALDLQQGYLRYEDGRWQAQLGRQEVALGSSRLVSLRDGQNIRAAFDGLRAAWQGRLGPWPLRLDVLALRPVENRPGAFDDRADRGKALASLYATAGATARSLELYLFDYARDDARFAAATGEERRRSAGMRLSGRAAGWDWNNEAVYQRGHVDAAGGRLSIRAWTLATDNGYRWSLRGSLRLGLKADIASGDGDLHDRLLGTFNAMFPKAPYFSEASLLAPANLVDLQPSLTLQPATAITTTIGWQLAWKQRRADAIYVTPMPATPLPGSAGGDRRIGQQYKWETAWQASTDWQWQLHLDWFQAGRGLRQAGGRDTAFISVMGAWQW